MGALDSLKVRKLLAKGVIGQVSDDLPVAIRLKAKTAAGAVTSVTVTPATNIVLITATGGTETYAFATYDTIGKVVDAINAGGYWEARALDGLRSDASASVLITGAIAASTEKGVTYYDALFDTSNADHLAYCLTNSRAVGEETAKGSHRVNIQSIIYNVTLGGGADTNGLKVYQRSGTTETLVYQATPTSGSEQTVTWASGEGMITSDDGAELIVKIVDATSVTGSLTVVGIAE